MQMDAGLDSGPIVAQREVELAGEEIAPELESRLSRVAAELLTATLGDWLAGLIHPRAQAADGVTMTKQLRREDGRLDPAKPAAELERQVRAYQPWPGSFIESDGDRLVVWRRESSIRRRRMAWAFRHRMACSSWSKYSRPGGRRMPAADYVRGRSRLSLRPAAERRVDA
jgi:methionyl-tRNA formyltransferase